MLRSLVKKLTSGRSVSQLHILQQELETKLVTAVSKFHNKAIPVIWNSTFFVTPCLFDDTLPCVSDDTFPI